jgi:hypothetical protein
MEYNYNIINERDKRWEGGMMKLYKLFWSIIIALILIALCIDRPIPQEICTEQKEVIITDKDLENFRKYLEKK